MEQDHKLKLYSLPPPSRAPCLPTGSSSNYQQDRKKDSCNIPCFRERKKRVCSHALGKGGARPILHSFILKRRCNSYSDMPFLSHLFIGFLVLALASRCLRCIQDPPGQNPLRQQHVTTPLFCSLFMGRNTHNRVTPNAMLSVHHDSVGSIRVETWVKI
eukprot:822648-Amphidinium_carterae.2